MAWFKNHNSMKKLYLSQDFLVLEDMRLAKYK